MPPESVMAKVTLPFVIPAKAEETVAVKVIAVFAGWLAGVGKSVVNESAVELATGCTFTVVAGEDELCS